MRHPNITIALMLAATASSAPAAARDLVTPALEDGMMVQADQQVRVWGQAAPRDVVTVSYSDKAGVARAESDETGRWFATLPARKAGETFAIAVKAQSGDSEHLDDLLAGDVWLCSGQSNMEMMVKDAANAPQVMARGGRYPIRIAKVRRTSVPARAESIAYAMDWGPASPDKVGEFSAACWHMGEVLAEATGRPIGLIQSAWGGTTIEDWIDAPSLSRVGDYGEALTLLPPYATDPEVATSRLAAETEAWIAKASPASAHDGAIVQSASIADWPVIDLPQLWERSGIKELSDFNGIVWFARDIELTHSEMSSPLVLNLERIDERDAVFVNGTWVGANVDPTQKRSYTVPASVLKPGSNRIMIRVVDERGSGGFGAQNDWFVARPRDGAAIPLAGKWHYRIADDIKQLPSAPPVPWKAPRGMTTLFNGMIAPLAPMALKGVAWYQGESNTGVGQGPLYHDLLVTMIAGWRKAFEQPALPFVIVQLPGFGAHMSTPEPSGWAELREAQRSAVADTDGAALAVLIDSGEEFDIHPRHKLLAGQRMANAAQRLAYGDATQPVSPYPISAVRNDNDIVVRYPQNTGFKVFSALDPTGMQVCDSAGVCRFAHARIQDDAIIIVNAASDTREIRYAWEDTPIVNLYSNEGMPAAPFRLQVEDQ